MNYHHQLELLVDILQNQQDEKYGTHDEYEQIGRLVTSLLQNASVPQDVKSALTGIEHFAYQHDQEGARGNLSATEIDQWVQQIQSSEQSDTSTYM